MYITAHHKYGALLSFWIFFFHRQLYQVSIDYQAPLWVWPSLCLSAKSSLPFPKLWIAPMVSVLNTVPSIRFSNIRTCRIQSRSALTPFSVSFASEFHSVEQHLLAFKKKFEVPGEKRKSSLKWKKVISESIWLLICFPNFDSASLTFSATKRF